LSRWKSAAQKKHVTTMIVGTFQKEVLDLLAEEML
jgi:hypothetical protein